MGKTRRRSRQAGRILLLLICLAWLELLNEAVLQNIRVKESALEQETEAQEKETSRQEQQRQPEEEASASREQPKEEDTPVPTQQPEPEKLIRVLLMDDGYESYYHPYVTVSTGEGEATYTGESSELSSGTLRLASEEGIQVTSINRQSGHPLYQGTLEIQKKPQGLLLINELPLEEYLKAVVPSEMPSSYEKEALKAQAVCARTYAGKQMEEKSLKEYDADVDDSVNFQVYWNIEPEEAAIRAVEETRGKVLTQNGELIQAYYFSTSAGATSTDEIWGATDAAPYLKSVECTFDSQEPWSRWSVEIPWQRLQENAQRLKNCSGELISLEIRRKNQSGAVTGLLVVTAGGSQELCEEYQIRQFLSPRGCDITEKDGTVTAGGSLLPSAYFQMDVLAGQSVQLLGGGYGHGVGMSQNGANQMAKEGYTWEEILNYFFKDIQITEMA